MHAYYTYSIGDRVQIIGIYRGRAGAVSGSTHGGFKTYLLATNVRVLTKDIKDDSITQTDKENIHEVGGVGLCRLI